MSCENFTTNGRPVGIGYDANGNAKSLAELTTLIVSSVSATNYQNIYLSSLSDVSATSPGENTYLKWDGSKWIAVNVEPGGGVTNAFSTIQDQTGEINAIGSDSVRIGSENSTIQVTVDVVLGENQINIEADPANIAELINLGDLNDVDFSLPLTGTYVTHDGSKWTNLVRPEVAPSFGYIVAGSVTATADTYTDTVTFNSDDGTVSILSVTGEPRVNFSIGSTLSNYATTASLNNYATTASLGNYATIASLNNYATTASLGNYATIASLNNYATTASLDSYATTASLNNYQPLNDLLTSLSVTSLTGTPDNNQILKYVDGVWTFATDSGGVTKFFDLEDTPSLTGASVANRFVIVNQDGDALEFSESLANAVIINSDAGAPEALGVDEFFRITFLGNSTNVPTYKFNKTTSSVPYAWPNGTLMTYQLGTSSFNLSDPSVWWTAVAPTFSHNTLGGLTTGNPHPQYATLSGAIFTGSILAPSVSATGVSATTFNGKSLAGVTYNSIQDGDILVWDNTSSVWYNSSSLSDLQTSTINLSAYIAANEALWSSGASEPSSVVSIQFETGIVTELNIGEIAWNDDYSTIDIQTSTDTTLQVGQEQVIKVRNETGDTLYNGDVVYVSGVHGTGAAKLQVAKASANTDCTIQNIVGICTQDISHNSDGFITTFGYVRNVNTSAFSVGDVVYLANTAGEYTNTQEAKPSHSIRLGTVARTHATDGIIFVKIDPGYDTTFLHDVENDPPESSGQVLIWNSTSSLYQHGGHNSLADLTVGNPHTQYATLSGATFTGNISGTNMVLTGTLEAATKSFLIDHPTKADMKLRYACLEGPENGVYYRGKTESSIIELPDYWVGLIDENSISINLTPIGHIQNSLRVNNIENNKIELASNDPIKAFFIVYATRKDVPNLLVEF